MAAEADRPARPGGPCAAHPPHPGTGPALYGSPASVRL